MKVYVAIAIFDYEGTNTIGVFDTEEKAQNACDNYKYLDGELHGDSRIIEEHNLNEADNLDALSVQIGKI